MPSLVTDLGQDITESVSAIVETSASVNGPWTDVPFLFCDRLMLAVNGYDEADLVHELGEVVQPGSFVFNSYQPLNILGQYVRITIPQQLPRSNIVWHGFIVGTANERSAVKGVIPAVHELTGRKQVLKAVGLEYFLDRVQIDAAYIYDGMMVLRSIPFNGGQGVSLDADTRTRANRSENQNAEAVYQFAPADEDGELWTLHDIIQYLTTYFGTEDTGGNSLPCPYSVGPAEVISGVLNGISPSLDPEGMTTFQVLNKLLSPQRGYVWWLEFDGASGVAYIRAESLANAIITLPTTGTIPANSDQQSLDFDRQRDVRDVVIAEKGSRVYHQVICRGARMTSTCTVGNVSTAGVNELVEGWTTELQAEYEEAAAGTDGYADLSDSDKAKRNDAFRTAERFYSVYAAFRLSAEWDGKSGDGSDAERDWTFPVLSANGSVLDTLEFSVRGIRFLNHTRLKRGWDYRDTAAIEQTQPDGVEAEYMPLFAILQVSNESEIGEGEPGYPGTIPAKYQFVEKMSQHEFAAGELVSDAITTSYTVRSDQTHPGIILNSHGMNHAAALTNWSDIAPTEHEPQVAYDSLRVTVTMEADTYCVGKFPADVDLPANVPLQKLVLYVGEEYRLDFLAENTVVDLQNGEPVLTNGGVLRDDRQHVANIARVAYEWYQQDRRPITVAFRQISNSLRLGMLITTIGEGATLETVNSVVSVIDYNLKDGVMTIKTNDEDLDLTRVV